MKVRLDPYNNSWPEVFAQERELLMKAGRPVLSRVDHVGSTSIPPIAAKPVVDILGGAVDIDEVTTIVEVLSGIGYEYVPEYQDEIPDRRYFRKGERPCRLAHLHIFQVGSPGWEEMLLFRDYLRAHPEEAAAYEVLKRDLATRLERAEYTDAKEPYIRRVLEKARASSTRS